MTRINDLLWELSRTARAFDSEKSQHNSYYCSDNTRHVHAHLFAYFNIMFEKIPEDDFLKTYILEKLNELLEELNHKAVMDKLESENG